MADPVADKSGFLCTYMSSHPDTLVAYAKHFGKVDGHVVSAKMLSIDSKGMNLEYNTKNVVNRPQIVHIEFDPPLLGYEEVKPRLLSMKADADEALGIVKAPQITHFEMPFQIWITSSLLILFIYGTCMPSNPKGAFWWLASTLRPRVFPDGFFPVTWVIVVIIHVGEGLYATTLARKHRMPWNIAAAWVASATIFGFPVLMRIRRLVKEARIESIMKGR
ncbi:hypothetical protein EDB87DRAFT_1675754 [Lactarius vividus]|nr:hypothetical protein EDB87DRAFT_1675754 [Lactarius vividus]